MFMVSLGGLALGVLVGMRFKPAHGTGGRSCPAEKDLERLVRARVLVGIPHLNAPGEDLLRARTRWMEIGAAVGIVILIVAGNLYAFYKG